MNTSPAGKSTALIAYAPFVGFLIAYFINRDENHEFATWHIKNMFGLFILFVVFDLNIYYIVYDTKVIHYIAYDTIN